MKFALSLTAVVLLAAGCGTQASTQAAASPTSAKFGTATLSETGCEFTMPTALPIRVVSFTLVNTTRFTGHFGLTKIDDGHTFQDLVDFWSGPGGKETPASFATLVAEQPVAPNSSMSLAAEVKAAGTYAFHCGYRDQDDNVTGFWYELTAA